MSNWQELTEDDVTYYVNEEFGNVIKVGDAYIAMVPRIVKMGPFKTLEEAKSVVETKQEALNNALDEFNFGILEGK